MSTRRILIGIIVVLIVCAGLVTGILFSDKARNDRITGFLAAPPEKIEPNFNTYQISPPSRGAFLITQDVSLSSADENVFAVLSKEEAAKIKTGQRVLLYNAQGAALEILGEVSAVTLDADQKAIITIALKENKESTPETALVTTGKIITDNIPDAQRLPLSAIVNKDGTKYLWEISRNQDGTFAANFNPANIAFETDNFVVLAENPHSPNVFVLNPDDALRDGQTINVKESLYSGPAVTEETHVLVMIKERNKKIREERYEGTKTPQISLPPAISCKPGAKGLESFIGQIKKLTADQKIKELEERSEKQKAE